MKIIIPVVVVILVIITAGILIYPRLQKNNPPTITSKQETTNNEEVNIQAKFAIFTNGTLRVFTDSRYHKLNKEIYIDPADPNTVNVKESGKTWNDFFATLPMKLDKECLTTGTGQLFCTNENQKLKFYLNRKLDPNALDKQINQNDELLISFGNESETEINNQFLQTFGL